MKIRDWLHIVWEQIGFNSISEMVQSTVSWKHKLTTVYLASIPVAGIITAVETFTEDYIYTPALGIVILWITSFLDVILGLSVAVSNKIGIVPTRLSRALIRVLVQTLIVGLFFQMSHVWDYLITSWMVDSLLIVFTLSTFYSVIQNAAALGLITKEQYTVIEGMVNLNKLISKFRKNNDKTPNL